MKTAISIPDELFHRADELADRLGKSRSEVYREALADYVARREPNAVTDALNALADEINKEDLTFVTEAARQTFERTEW
jgi:predicted transcriptional regulator